VTDDDRTRRVAAALAAAGASADAPVIAPDELVPPPAPEGVTLQRVDAWSGADAHAAVATAWTGPDPAPEDVAAVAGRLGDGLGVLARLGPAPAGAGRFAPPVEGVAVVLDVAADDEAVAAALRAELARLAFRAGANLVALPR
jgi:hypothetical protein